MKLNLTQNKTAKITHKNQTKLNNKNPGKTKKRDKDGMMWELLKAFQKAVG